MDQKRGKMKSVSREKLRSPWWAQRRLKVSSSFSCFCIVPLHRVTTSVNQPAQRTFIARQRPLKGYFMRQRTRHEKCHGCCDKMRSDLCGVWAVWKHPLFRKHVCVAVSLKLFAKWYISCYCNAGKPLSQRCACEECADVRVCFVCGR